MSPLTFSRQISIINGNPYVRPPDEVLEGIFAQAGKSTSPISVKGNINGSMFEQSLVKYAGDWRLYINITMAKAAAIPFAKSISEIVGTEVTFEITFNPNPRKYQMIPFLKNAIDKNPLAKSNWEKLILSRKKEILRYFSTLKSEEAKARNLVKVLDALTKKDVRFMARSWKNGR